jgi:hypothetical protein
MELAAGDRCGAVDKGSLRAEIEWKHIRSIGQQQHGLLKCAREADFQHDVRVACARMRAGDRNHEIARANRVANLVPDAFVAV